MERATWAECRRAAVFVVMCTSLLLCLQQCDALHRIASQAVVYSGAPCLRKPVSATLALPLESFGLLFVRCLLGCCASISRRSMRQWQLGWWGTQLQQRYCACCRYVEHRCPTSAWFCLELICYAALCVCCCTASPALPSAIAASQHCTAFLSAFVCVDCAWRIALHCDACCAAAAAAVPCYLPQLQHLPLEAMLARF